MIILKPSPSGKTRLSFAGDRNNFPRASSRAEDARSRLVNRTDLVTGEGARKMEFMYCIPDLEVFIDKTIKKCLLEYDLDANDTEAVLDDMEKAWPKTQLRSSDKPNSKDVNDSTENECGVGGQDSEVCKVPDGKEALPEKASETGGDIALPPDKDKVVDKREVAEGHQYQLSMWGERVDAVSGDIQFMSAPLNITDSRELLRVVAEGDRSDNSSPDVGDGALQTQKPSKLKSRLQQRYFQGQESSTNIRDQSEKVTSEEKLNHKWESSKHLSSNLDLLASAANIHTESLATNEEHRLLAIRRLQEESERHFQKKSPLNEAQKSSDDDASKIESSSHEPTQQNVITLPELYRNKSFRAVNGLDENKDQGTQNPDGHQSRSPSRSPSEKSTAIIRQKEAIPISISSNGKAQQVSRQYQNGYHTVIQRETASSSREATSPSIERDAGFLRMPTELQSTHANLPGVKDSDQPARYPQYPPHIYNQMQKQGHPYTDMFFETFHYHSSRIAHIIAEELQKDDSNELEPQPKLMTQPLVRIIPSEAMPSVTRDSLAVKSALPGPYGRSASNEVLTSPTEATLVPRRGTSIQQHMDIIPNHALPHYGPPHQLLSAHFVGTRAQTNSPILSAHLNHSSGRSNGIIGHTNILLDEDQPQDLSIKSRKPEQNEARVNNSNSHNTTQKSTIPESIYKKLNSSANHPATISSTIHVSESQTLPKTSHNSKSSSLKLDYEVGGSAPLNQLKKSRSWGDPKHLNAGSSGYSDQHVLAKKRKLNDTAGLRKQETAAAPRSFH